MQNNIEGLRERMFAIMDALRDEEKPIDIERAKAISEAAQVIINSAKVEVDYVKATGGKGSGFIPEALPTAGVPRLVKGKAASGSA